MITSSVSAALKARGSEQRAKDRQIAQSRELADVAGDVVLDQAGYGETLAAAEADRCLRAAHAERRYLQIADLDRALVSIAD